MLAVVLGGGLLLALLQVAGATAATTLTVCAAGPPTCQYSTIQDALAVAADGDSVAVAPGTYSAGFTIAHSIRLIGSGAGATIITGGDPFAITISADATVLIRGVTITDAARTGIVNDGTLTVRDSSITGTNPTFEGQPDAGGVLNNGTLLVSGTTISDNFAYNGGAILNIGAATVTNSTLSENQAVFDAGGIDNNGSLVVRDSTFEGNGAQGAGAISNGMFSAPGEVLIVNTLITGNGGGTGAIINAGGALTLKGSTVNFNQGSFNHPVIENDGSMVISESAIDNNRGGIGNVAMMTITSSSVSDNTDLGGIRNEGTLTVRGSTIRGNTTQFNGGGILNSGSLFLKSSIVTQNTAVLGQGGGIFNHLLGTVTLRQSSVTGNTPDDCFGCWLERLRHRTRKSAKEETCRHRQRQQSRGTHCPRSS